MWWWHGGSAWVWLLMTVGMVAFWGIVVWAIATFVRGQSSSPAHEDPAAVLARRLASGEIDEDTYHRLLAVLRGAPASR